MGEDAEAQTQRSARASHSWVIKEFQEMGIVKLSGVGNETNAIISENTSSVPDIVE